MMAGTGILEAFGEALNRRDLDLAMSYFTDDCCYQASAGPELEGRTFGGRAAVRAGLEDFLARYPDGRFEDVDFFVVGDRGFGEWTFVGTSREGQSVRIRGCDLYELASGKIRRKNAFRKQLEPTAAGAAAPEPAAPEALPTEALPTVRAREPYRPRSARFIELWQPDGWLLKLYGLAYEGERPRAEVVEAAKRSARAALPRPGRTHDRYGVGFVIVHDGQDACWLLIDWWGNESVLHHRPLTAPLSAPQEFHPVPRDVAACVWELPLLAFERDAWVSAVLTDNEPDVGRYLECRFDGVV
jgi:ketosteroid isomerase-like protein